MNSRFLRQISIEQIGEQGQESLGRSSVIVVGAGGLGSPALTYLVMSGVGKVTLVDKDVVEASNLNRQFLYNENDIGQKKAEIAAQRLSAINSDTVVSGLHTCLTEENAVSLLQGHSIVLGAVDSFSTRNAINHASTMLKIPYIDGGVNGFSGSVVFSSPPDTPCLNCVYPVGTMNVRPIGTLGTTVGIIGTAMANIAILHLLGQKNPLLGKLFLYDGQRMETNLLSINRNEACLICKAIE